MAALALLGMLAAACSRDAGMQTPATGAVPAMAGGVRVLFYNVADSDFDRYSEGPGEDEQRWMREHYRRMQTYTPYFDSRLAWFPNAWVYKDSYAIKPAWPVFAAHPEWVLHGPDGAPLYIPWGCARGSCPQYAGDFGNPDFRDWWIADARALIAKGYRGLYIDDVNLAWRVSDGNGRHVVPLDPRTGAPMSMGAWRRYHAEFMEEVRAALPGIEIAHNSLWFVDARLDDSVAREIDAADYINLERGANDPGLRGGGGRFSFDRLLAFIDEVHARGRHVILMDYGNSLEAREYALAAWFLIQSGPDMLGSNQLDWTAPGHYWRGYTLDLGPALGARSDQQRLLRREYACGLVLLNEPDQPTRIIELQEPYTDLEGRSVQRVALPAWRAKVLLKACARLDAP